jgi:hypothetical protein
MNAGITFDCSIALAAAANHHNRVAAEIMRVE